MEFLFLEIIILILAMVGFYAIYKHLNSIKNNNNNNYGKCNGEAIGLIESNSSAQVYTEEKQEPLIKVEQLPIKFLSEANLVEIEDKKILGYIGHLIPNFLNLANNGYNLKNAFAENGKVFYKAVIPAGEKLAKAKGNNGTFRGFYFGEKGIKGHAEFIPQEVKNGPKMLANGAAMVMNVAAVIVGQYYMKQINSKLESISDELTKVANFQNNEFRSKVQSLVAYTKNLTDFETELTTDQEVRNSKITQLDRLEEKCTELLGQATLTVTNYTKNQPEYIESYERDTQEVNEWFCYQNILLNILLRISELRYVFGKGSLSREQCNDVFNMYLKEVETAQNQLNNWHSHSVQKFRIHLSTGRRERGSIEQLLIVFLPLAGIAGDNLAFVKLPEGLTDMIITQGSKTETFYNQDKSKLYHEELELVSKEGRLYLVKPTV